MKLLQRAFKKIPCLAACIALVYVPCISQVHTRDTLAAGPDPVLIQQKRLHAVDSAGLKPVTTSADSLKPASPIAADTSKKTKKAEGLTDTVYYGTDGGYIDYDIEKKSLRLIHNAMTRYQDITLYADTIVYRIDDAIFEATGKPQLIEKGDTTVGESMLYNIKTKRGRVRYATSHMDEAFFNGKQIIKSPKNELYIDQGDYTTCAYPEDPHFFFYGKNIKLIPDDKIICRPVVFSVGGAPIGALPFIWFPIQKNRKSGLLTPIWGGHPESGGYLDNLGYYWAFSDYVDLQLSARVQEFQEFVFNGASSYSKKYELNGNISGHYTYNGDFNQRNQQWSLNYSHNQTLIPDGSMTLTGSGSLVSDQSFYRNFSDNDTDILNQSLRANLSLAKRFENINASANISWDRQQNLSTGDITDNLPNVSFSLPTRSLIPVAETPATGGTGKSNDPAWYNKITYSYNAQGEQKIHGRKGYPDTSQKEIAQSVDLNAPLTVLKWFTVNPHFNTNIYAYDKFYDTSASVKDSISMPDTTFDTLHQKPPDSVKAILVSSIFDYNTGDTVYTYKEIKSITPRKIPFYKEHRQWTYDAGWNTGVGLSTTLYGLYPIPLFNFVGIRHILRPSVDYGYTPKHDMDKNYKAVLGGEGPHDKSKTVSLSISNEFQGKTSAPAKTAGEKPQETKFQILSGSVSTGYDFQAKQNKWKDLSVNASTGYSVFRLSYNSTFWMYNQNNQLSRPLLQSYHV